MDAIFAVYPGRKDYTGFINSYPGDQHLMKLMAELCVMVPKEMCNC